MHREANSSQPFSTGRRGEKGITLVIYCYVTNYVKLSGSRQQVCMTPSLCGPGLWAGLTRLVWAPGLPWPRPASYRGLGHLKSGRGWRGCPRGPHGLWQEPPAPLCCSEGLEPPTEAAHCPLRKALASPRWTDVAEGQAGCRGDTAPPGLRPHGRAPSLPLFSVPLEQVPEASHTEGGKWEKAGSAL